MNDDDAELVKAAAEGAVSAATAPINQLISNLFGPVTEEIGLDWRDRYIRYRNSRLARFFDTTKQLLDGRGLPAEPVAPKLLVPILENASLEDDDYLQDRWASLLVNAATRRGRDILPSAPELLKQLNPWEVLLLERCYDSLTMNSVYPYPQPERQSQAQTLRDWEIDLQVNRGFAQPLSQHYFDFGVMITNVCRLGLMEKAPNPDGKNDIYLTRMGAKLVEMCADFGTFKTKQWEPKQETAGPA